jgi:predicted membrane-bound spermidine synthase
MKQLLRYEDEGRRIRISEFLYDGSRAYYENEILYTHVDAWGNNLLDYVDAMARLLEGAETVLLLGTAGGALATHLHRRGAQVTAVDNLAVTFEVARRWFHMPEQVECVHADAFDFLQSTPRRWDAVAVDIFLGADIPEALISQEFAELLVKVAGDQIIWNVADGFWSQPARAIAKMLSGAGQTPRIRPAGSLIEGNTLVVCRP